VTRGAGWVLVGALLSVPVACLDGISLGTNNRAVEIDDRDASGGNAGVSNPAGGTGGIGGNTGGIGGNTGGIGGSTGGIGGSTGGIGGNTGGIGGNTGGIGGGGSAGVGGWSGSGSDTGTCCASGDCLCHGPAPTGLTSRNGSFMVASYVVSTGRIYFPTDARPPFAGLAVCAGFLNTGPEMNDWGTFYASHGIVAIITNTLASDDPAIRGRKLVFAIDELKAENTRSGGPLYGKMSDRYGTSGYSMGGGGTTIASALVPTMRSSVGLAPWAPKGTTVQVPTLLLCGDADPVAPCSHVDTAYTQLPDTTPKMKVVVPGAEHLASWFSPSQAEGIPAEAALAFNKVYLEGDERWKPFLKQTRGTKTTNIQ
jgi:dienelactone hydrolase